MQVTSKIESDTVQGGADVIETADTLIYIHSYIHGNI